jgi:hypothetical protein
MTKIEAFWENATADDVARVMKGETVEARFRGDSLDRWKELNLAGWSKLDPLDELVWAGRGWASHYRYCQVYREPSWWTNKPDPGPGYRLLGKFPDEPKLATDEAWNWDDSEWQSIRKGGDQECETWYRRRIEPVEPVESKPLLIRRMVVEIGDEIKLPNGRVLVFNGEGFEVIQ